MVLYPGFIRSPPILWLAESLWIPQKNSPNNNSRKTRLNPNLASHQEIYKKEQSNLHPKTSKSPLRNDAWETNKSTFLLGRPFFCRGELVVGRVITTRITRNRLQNNYKKFPQTNIVPENMPFAPKGNESSNHWFSGNLRFHRAKPIPKPIPSWRMVKVVHSPWIWSAR